MDFKNRAIPTSYRLYEYIRSRTIPPSVEEMVEALGYRSPSPIQAALGKLRADGLVKWEERKARTYEVVGEWVENV